MTEPKTECKRCGRCCVYWKDGQLKDCKFLVRYLKGEKRDPTFCMIYMHRIGAIIDRLSDGRPMYCMRRDEQGVNIPNCPYNNPHLPPSPYFK